MRKISIKKIIKEELYKTLNEDIKSIDDIRKLDNYSNNCGFTEIHIKNNQLSISHNGNMGNTIERSVDPNLKICGFPPIKILKKKFKVLSETGDPDYSYTIIFKIK